MFSVTPGRRGHSRNRLHLAPPTLYCKVPNHHGPGLPPTKGALLNIRESGFSISFKIGRKDFGYSGWLSCWVSQMTQRSVRSPPTASNPLNAEWVPRVDQLRPLLPTESPKASAEQARRPAWPLCAKERMLSLPLPLPGLGRQVIGLFRA